MISEKQYSSTAFSLAAKKLQLEIENAACVHVFTACKVRTAYS